MQIGLTTSVVRPVRTGGSTPAVPDQTVLRDSNNTTLLDSNSDPIKASS